MRIGIVIADMMLRGGGERVVATLANHFVSEFGYEVGIFSLNRTNGEIPYELDTKVELQDTGIDLHVDSSIQKATTKLRSLRAIKDYLSSNELDYVLGVGTYPSVALALIGSGSTKRIGYEQVAFEACPSNWQLLRRLTYPKLDAVVALTEYDRRKLSRLNQTSTCIPNCTDFSPPGSANMDEKTLLSVGRLTTQKGFDYLLKVFHRIHELRPDWKLRIIGDGELKQELLDTIQRLDLQGCVSICPGTRDIEREYLQASIYVMTSRWEGFPLVLLEAQACGLPVVSFDCPTGPAEVITDAKDGYLVSDYDNSTMTERILRLIDSRALRCEFSNQARINAEKYSVRNVSRLWQAIFENTSV